MSYELDVASIPMLRLLLPLLLLLTLPAGAQEVPEASSGRAPAFQALSRAELEAQDRRVSFVPLSAQRALTDLVDSPEAVLERTVALLAVGCAGRAADMPSLESRAVDGPLSERRLAILALGEAGEAGAPALLRLLEGDTRQLRVHLILALLRSGAPAARARVEQLASGSGSDLGRAARELLSPGKPGVFPDPLPAYDVLLQLRWRAAQRYGLIDGKRPFRKR